MDSKQVNKVIRKELSDFLLSNSFIKLTDRKYLKTTDLYFYLIEIKSVGKYFSDVTGWPPQSICSFGGIFCRFIKSQFEFKNGIPSEGFYHFRIENKCNLIQDINKNKLENPAERNRDDLWWIDDNSNLLEIINDVKDSITNYSLNYFRKFNDLMDIIPEIEKMKDSYNKYWNAYYTFKSLHMQTEENIYKTKLLNEAKRIGKQINENEL